MDVILFLTGLIFLLAGGSLLVRGASHLGGLVGIPPLIIGLTVVAFGTSAPELAVSVQSALAGRADLALGNVVGSNIFNVLFILGVSATITPLVISRQLLRLDVPIMIGAGFLVLVLGLDQRIGRIDGAVLVLGIVSYTAFLIYHGRKEVLTQPPPVQQESKRRNAIADVALQMGFILAGLALLVVGARWLVSSAVAIATALGVSELVIGLTIVAAGTSLPEVATSVIASVRGERDIAVGNVVGSNIFNILAVLGFTGLVAPEGIRVSTAALYFDMPLMIAVAVACLPIFFTGKVIARWEGLLFLAYYGAYSIYIVLQSTHHDLLPIYSLTMMLFVAPITVVTLVVVSWRAVRGRRN